MKPYRILKDFSGAQDGVNVEDFTAGAVVGLTDHLARLALAEGWIEPAAEDSPFGDPTAAEPNVKKRGRPRRTPVQ